jgi:hypothetical protein
MLIRDLASATESGLPVGIKLLNPVNMDRELYIVILK